MMKVGMENNGKAYQSFAGMLSPGLSFDKKKVRSAVGGASQIQIVRDLLRP